MLDAGARSRLAATRFADVQWLEEVDSTNRVALERARGGAPEGLVVVADHQTAGRGRLGRTWEAPPGSSLLVSVLLRPAGDPHGAVIAAALAACDACADVCGVTVGLKWPNDLVVDDRKLAGVLAETDGGTVVVGTGINVNWPQPMLASLGDATALNHLAGHDVDRAELLVRLLERLDARLSDGPAATLIEYRARCSTLGRTVRVDLGHETLAGKAVDLTPEGHLVVETSDGRRDIAAGDVVHVRPA